MLLQEGKRNAQHHHNNDHRGGPLVTEEVRDCCERQQQEIERVLGASDQLLDEAFPALVSNEVRAEAGESLGRRLCGQTLGCRIEPFQQLPGFRSSSIDLPLGNGGVPMTMWRRQTPEALPP